MTLRATRAHRAYPGLASHQQREHVGLQHLAPSLHFAVDDGVVSRLVLFTMMSSRPVSRTARSRFRPCTCRGSRTSSEIAVALPLDFAISPAASSSEALVRPAKNTCAPAAPRRIAIARPIPLEAPVTIAVLPLSDSDMQILP